MDGGEREGGRSKEAVRGASDTEKERLGENWRDRIRTGQEEKY